MSLYCYVQLFLFGLLYTGVRSEENATCTIGRAQSNIDMNQVYGDWFLGQINIPDDGTADKSQCFTVSLKKINESFVELSMTVAGEICRGVFSIENVENAGTWRYVDGDVNGTAEVIYLSADGTTMVMAFCYQNIMEQRCILLDRQLPISSEKIEQVLHAVEVAGTPESHCRFTWKSEATCPST